MTELSPEIIKDFVLAGHFDLQKIKTLLAEQPALLNVEHQWGENDFESALGAASHVGNVPIAQYLLEQGAPMTITTAAMLGDIDIVADMIGVDKSLVTAKGAHGITIMFHTALSGNVEIADMLKELGNNEGYNHALHGAVMKGHVAMARWLLNNGVTDTQTKNFQGKTPLETAQANDNAELIALLS